MVRLANRDEDEKMIRFNLETIEVTMSLSENVFQVARLICQIKYDLDWDQYVSAFVK